MKNGKSIVEGHAAMSQGKEIKHNSSLLLNCWGFDVANTIIVEWSVAEDRQIRFTITLNIYLQKKIMSKHLPQWRWIASAIPSKSFLLSPLPSVAVPACASLQLIGWSGRQISEYGIILYLCLPIIWYVYIYIVCSMHSCSHLLFLSSSYDGGNPHALVQQAWIHEESTFL